MSNNDSQMALQYHRETSHSLQSLRSNTWRLDWSNRPFPLYVLVKSSLWRFPLPPSESSAQLLSVNRVAKPLPSQSV